MGRTPAVEGYGRRSKVGSKDCCFSCVGPSSERRLSCGSGNFRGVIADGEKRWRFSTPWLCLFFFDLFESGVLRQDSCHRRPRLLCGRVGDGVPDQRQMRPRHVLSEREGLTAVCPSKVLDTSRARTTGVLAAPWRYRRLDLSSSTTGDRCEAADREGIGWVRPQGSCPRGGLRLRFPGAEARGGTVPGAIGRRSYRTGVEEWRW